MRAWLLSLLLLGAMPPARAAEPSAAAILEGQVRVLKQLLEEGVIEAAYHLALLARAHPSERLFAAGEAGGWMATAAAAGQRAAIRALALALLQSGDGDEAATLIAVAALLGDQRAAADLHMLPMFTDLTATRVAAAFDRALGRLAASSVIDCGALPPPCPANASERLRLSPQELLRLRAMRDHGPHDPATVQRLLAPLLAGYSNLDGGDEERFRHRQRDSNRPLLAALEKAHQAVPSAAGQAYRDRRGMRSAAADQVLAAVIGEDLTHYRTEIDRVLAGINRHREAADRITLEAVLDDAGGRR